MLRPPNDSGCRKRANFAHATFLERLRTRLHRCAGGAHIVYQDDDRSRQPTRSAGHHKPVADVRVPTRGGQTGLRGGGTDTAKSLADRQSEVSREIGRLIEAPLAVPRSMQRHGDHACGTSQHLGAAFAHEGREPLRQRPAPVVLQRVHDRTKRAVVLAHRAGEIHGWLHPPATRADRERPADDPPARERIAAALAEGRCEGKNGTPAAATYRTIGRMLQRGVAHRARRREHDGENGVER